MKVVRANGNVKRRRVSDVVNKNISLGLLKGMVRFLLRKLEDKIGLFRVNVTIIIFIFYNDIKA